MYNLRSIYFLNQRIIRQGIKPNNIMGQLGTIFLNTKTKLWSFVLYQKNMPLAKERQ